MIDSTRSVCPTGLFCLLFVGITLSFFSPIALANDIVKRRIASEATAAQTDEAERRQRLVSLTRKINRYESRKAELIRRRIVREQGIESANRSVETFLGGLTLAGLGSGGSTVAVSSALAFAFTTVGQTIEERMYGGFRQPLIDMRTNDRQLYDELLESSPNSRDREVLIARALETSSVLGDVLRDTADPDQRSALIEYQADFVRYLRDSDLRDFENEAEVIQELGREFRQVRSDTAELATATRAFQARVETRLEEVETRQQTTEPEIARLGQVVVQQDRILTEHGRVLDMQGRQIDTHEARLDDLEGEIVDLDTAYVQLSSAVEFNQSLLYDALPTSAKIRALKNPEFLREYFTDDDKRQDVIERLEVQEEAQALLDTARNVQAGTQAIANILQRTGVLDNEDAGVAAGAVNVAVSAATLVGSVYTGNVLGVVVGASGLVTGVSNLFGGGDSNPGIGDILEGQLEIRRELLEARREIAEGVHSILVRVSEFEERTILAIEEISTSIQGVQWELGGLRVMLGEYSRLGVELATCEDFANRRTRYDGFVSERSVGYVPDVVTFATGELRTWDGLTQHYQTNAAQFRECFSAMRLLFSDSRIHGAFLMSTYTDDGGAGFLSNYIRPGFEPLTRILNRHYPLLTDGGIRTFCAILNSPLDYGGVDHRGYTRFASEPCGANDASNPFARLFGASGSNSPAGSRSWLLHPDALIHFTYLLLEVLPYYQMIDERGELLAAELVAYGDPGKDDMVEEEALETAYRLVNLAIAQQVLLTGDIFLPLVHRYLFSPLTSPTDRGEMIDVLTHNPLIARNYLVMQLHRELRLRTKQDYGDTDHVFVENLELYRDIFQSRDSGGSSNGKYEQLFGDYWEFSPTANEVVLRVGNGSGTDTVRFSLPTPSEVGSAIYSVSREYEYLVRLRSKIIDHVFRNDLELFSANDEEEFIRNGYFVWN